MLNKIMVFKNRKNNKNIENECVSDTWHKKLYFIFFFDKKKMIFIHSNREITSFNTAKNVKDESTNKLTASKLIAYNGIMPTKIYDKTKVTGIFMPPDLQR